MLNRSVSGVADSLAKGLEGKVVDTTLDGRIAKRVAGGADGTSEIVCQREGYLIEIRCHHASSKVDELEAINNPEDPAAGTRKVPFSKVVYIEQEDFRENPPKDFFRLAPGREVRLRYAYFVTCVGVIKDAAGNVVEVRCTYDPATRGGDAPDGRKVKGTIHWVNAATAVSRSSESASIIRAGTA